MRPQSIIMFERLFLASLVVSLLSFVFTYDQVIAQLDNDPALKQLGLGWEILVAAVAVSMGLYLVLWFLIAHKASKVAKWILVVLVGLGLIFAVPTALTKSWDVSLLFGLAVYALELAAIVYLFSNDAKAWFAGRGQVDASTFD